MEPVALQAEGQIVVSPAVAAQQTAVQVSVVEVLQDLVDLVEPQVAAAQVGIASLAVAVDQEAQVPEEALRQEEVPVVVVQLVAAVSLHQPGLAVVRVTDQAAKNRPAVAVAEAVLVAVLVLAAQSHSPLRRSNITAMPLQTPHLVALKQA